MNGQQRARHARRLARARLDEPDSDLFMLQPLDTVPSELVELIDLHVHERRRRRVRRGLLLLLMAAAVVAVVALR
ncbi:MAG: hypothetical protein HYX47_15970 [Burkholderiales bacterium]|nr:hypothetical protein [Burkholderiales bacterium]